MPKRKLNNVTQRADGRFVARRVFGYKADGSPNRKVFYGDTAAEAVQKLTDYARQVENGLNTDAASLTFGAWLSLWMSEYKLKAIRSYTYDTYDRLISSRIAPSLGKHKLLKLRPEHLQSFINGLKKDTGESLSVSTIKQIKCIISGALGQAVKNGLITRNPADALSLPKNGKKKKVGAYTPIEQTILSESVFNHRLYALFVVALGTGMRVGEILALKWSDIDFVQNELSVSASVARSKDRDEITGEITGSSLKVSNPKTRAGGRSIPLTLEVRQALIQHRDSQLSERFKAGAAWLNNDLVFCTALGGYLEYRNVTRIYKSRRDSVEVEKLGFHSLRHSFATNAISAGMDYFYLSRIMGHTSISITLDTYTDYMPDKSRSEMEKMEGVLLLKLA